MIDMKKSYYLLQYFLNRPVWVLIGCVLAVALHLFMDGTVWRMWGLYHSRKILEYHIIDIQKKNALVEVRLKKLSDPHFLEKEARDRFNMVGARDIVFIFSDEPVSHSRHLIKKNTEDAKSPDTSPKEVSP